MPRHSTPTSAHQKGAIPTEHAPAYAITLHATARRYGQLAILAALCGHETAAFIKLLALQVAAQGSSDGGSSYFADMISTSVSSTTRCNRFRTYSSASF